MTSSIQPPLLAWAWRIAVGDPAIEPGIRRHHARLEANRDLGGDGLLWIVQPDESGLDDSPEFDPVWGRRYWRGPTWVNSAWLLWLGLRRLGYEEPADRMASALAEAVTREACASTTTRRRAPAWARRTSPGRA